MITETATKIKPKLPLHPNHPNGRNAYAHIASVIKAVYGKSYKNILDKEFKNVMLIIKYCEDNPF